MNNQLSSKAKKLMEEIYNIVGEDEFILYGGTPLDLLLDKNERVHDLDIAIKGFNKYKIRKCEERIKKKGFKVIESGRRYYIHKNEKVILIYAKNNKWFLDIAFLNNPNLMGFFDIETLYFRYPQFDYVDKFNALEGIRKKDIRLVRDIKKENPHFLLGRFLRLCSKYNISIRNNQKILIGLKDQLESWKISNGFHKTAYLSCISSLLKSVVKTSVLKTIFPEIDNIIDLRKKDFINDVAKAKTKLDLVVLFNEYLKSPDNAKSFRSKIKSLKVRRWDKEDIECSKYFNY